ncbi:polysaccharide export outer membrane protein [Dysgonomonas sp. PH5-45]|uniref:polysaccharide biosynthesis/export family protein n=1 Tax=unclassified Dysgonomonas TaxID=2630389 RepID=UPI002475AF92|nr:MULTISPECIES: polysaccharide biosynthesis/export family protein [unclassified Dysgonomonas]MDH6354362.1 polysaccharide export outer membrane protein [Dysgonomonas sp. PH5-45]MDH6387262.1 polysaccharide export outer membrane protein [Dysgonomonas sp. PH5-37]
MVKYVRIFLLLITASLLFSCTAYKKTPYLRDASSLTAEQFKETALLYEAKVKPNDILRIIVNSASSPEAVSMFNMPLIPNTTSGVSETKISTGGSLQNYIVDKNGIISFPQIGDIYVAGLTRLEIENKITSLIYPKYVTEKPVVDVRFLNYHVTVLGEVAKPGVYTTDNNVLTLFDALAMAGDLTIYGKRDNVLLVREKGNGELMTYNINLQDKNILLRTDVYYLQQNDKIYVSPNKTKGNNSAVGTIESLTLSGLSILISVISIITR